MKPVEDVIACVIDQGTFISIAEKLGETCAKVFYHSPYETEYQDIRACVQGHGLDNVERLDDLFDRINEIDLFVFPDIGFSSLQRHLRSLGKAVWGHMGATDLELYRDFFLDILREHGLPTIHSETLVGVTKLAAYLKEHKNQWVKINRFRGNMETFRSFDYNHSIRKLDELAVIFGGAKEHVVFVVQDDLETVGEIGYDGWCIDGRYPSASFQGYEKKNELYLGSLLAAEDLPEEIIIVNEAMAPILENYGYRDWWATEIRKGKDGLPYFIDPTPRMPGQTGEHQLETLTNFADVIWQGANGFLIEPEFQWHFAAEATLHYDLKPRDPTVTDEWKTLHLPEDSRWFKFYHYCKMNGIYHFTAKDTDEIGVVLGVGDSVEEAIKHLQANLDTVKDLPVSANLAGFASLLDSIKKAEKQGVKFGGRIPKPAEIFKDGASL
jgi:hypothetical protein